MFNVARDEPLPLKFKVGDMVMGIDHGFASSGFLFAGKIIEVRQSMSFIRDNKYEIELTKELHDGDVMTWRVDEGNCKKFNKNIFLVAYHHFLLRNTSLKSAHVEDIAMMRALQPVRKGEKK